MKKKMIVVLLIACLGINMVPVMAFADASGSEGKTTESAKMSIAAKTAKTTKTAGTTTFSLDDEEDEDDGEVIEDGDDEDEDVDDEDGDDEDEDGDDEDGDDEDGDDEDEDGDDEDGDDEDEDGDDEAGDDEDDEVNFIRISSVNYNTNNGTRPVYNAKVADGDVNIAYEGWKGSDGTVSYSSYAAYGEDDEIFDTFKEGVEYTYFIRLSVKSGKTLTDDVKVQLNNQKYPGKIHKSKRLITLSDVYKATSVCQHNMTKKKTKVTCTSDGFITHKCKYCSYSYITDEIKSTGHKWVLDEENCENADEEEDGVVEYCCENCNKTKTEKVPRIKTVSLSCNSYTYNGQARKPAVKVVDAAGKVIPANQYTVEYEDNKNAGTATVNICFDGESSHYETELEKEFKINPASQPISVKVGSKKYKKSTLAKKSQKFSIGAKAKNKLTYKAGSKRLSVSSKGTVTVKKGTPKGTYKVTVHAAKSRNYKAASKTVTVKVA